MHEAYVLDELVPAGALAALEAAADRLVQAATLVKTEDGGGGAGGKEAPVASPSSPCAPAVEEFPACVLARASALLLRAEKEGAAAAEEGGRGGGQRRSLRALALLAAALRLRRASRSLRVDPSRGGYESLGEKLGVPADLLRPMLESGDYASSAAAGPASPASPLALSFSRGGLPERKLASLTLVLSLLAGDGSLAPAAFEALRAELKASARELASSFREVGARASPVSRSAKGGGKDGEEESGSEERGDDGGEEAAAAAAASPLSSPAGKPHRRYAVKLLVGEKEGTELGACFPALKLGRR